MMTTLNKAPAALFAGLCLGSLFAGCEPRRSESAPVVGNEDYEFVCGVAIDLSGSFQQQMADDGQGFQFLMSVLKRYFDDRSATNDKIIIAQLSGSNRPLLWEGTPLELRHDFPTSADFRSFLTKHAEPNGSMIHEGVRNALNYIASDARVAGGQARAAFFVLSDMLDNAPDPDESEQQLVDALSAYGQQGHVVGLYYVDQTLVPKWRQHLRSAGVHDYRVEPDFRGKPPLPSFE